MELSVDISVFWIHSGRCPMVKMRQLKCQEKVVIPYTPMSANPQISSNSKMCKQPITRYNHCYTTLWYLRIAIESGPVIRWLIDLLKYIRIVIFQFAIYKTVKPIYIYQIKSFMFHLWHHERSWMRRVGFCPTASPVAGSADRWPVVSFFSWEVDTLLSSKC